MRKLLIALLSLIALGFAPGCGSTSVILVPTEVDVDGVPYSIVQLAEPVRARVFVERDGQIIESSQRVDIPAGFWLIPPKPAGRNR